MASVAGSCLQSSSSSSRSFLLRHRPLLRYGFNLETMRNNSMLTTSLTGSRRGYTSSAASLPPRVELKENHLRLVDSSASSSSAFDYHYFWLRHNCNCTSGCRHPQTGERLVDGSEVPLDIAPLSVSLVPPTNNSSVSTSSLSSSSSLSNTTFLHIVWNDHQKHESWYPLDWLDQHAYGRRPVDRVHPPPASELSKVEFDFRTITSPTATEAKALESYLRKCGQILADYGLVIVRNRGLDTEAIINDFLLPGKDVIHTHFGRIEDLMTNNVTNQNNDQLGYTDAAVNLHTDQPFIANPPGMQMLHCMRVADSGGENFMVDATQAALYLKELDRFSFETLSTIPVRFHRKQKNFESIQVKPIIEVGPNGSIKQIRYSYFTMAPQNVAFADMEHWYRSYSRFAKIVRDPKHHYRFLLQPGDFVLYDNHRMLHAREAFTGPRHMRGVYFDRESLWQRVGVCSLLL
ncbi:putative Gamma-butyrobetaine hydroxylase [Balamuthia mandrillaris]